MRIETNGVEVIGHATQVKVNLKFQGKYVKLDELVLTRMKMVWGKLVTLLN